MLELVRQNQRGIASILIILIIVGLVGVIGFSVFQKNSVSPIDNSVKTITSSEVSNETINWSVYSHQELGFTIMYPKGEVIIDKESEDDGVVFTYPKYKDSVSYPPTSLQILRRGVSGGNALEALTSESVVVDGQRRVPEHEKVQINNAQGLRTTAGFASDYNFYVTDTDNSGYAVRIDASSDVNEDIEIFTKMLKTFRFTR